MVVESEIQYQKIDSSYSGNVFISEDDDLQTCELITYVLEFDNSLSWWIIFIHLNVGKKYEFFVLSLSFID